MKIVIDPITGTIRTQPSKAKFKPTKVIINTNKVKLSALANYIFD